MSEAESEYLKIWSTGVIQFDLFQFHEVSIQALIKKFGAPTTEGDEHDQSPGPASYWLLQYSCGLKVILQFYECNNGLGTLVVYADKAEYSHVKRHLALNINSEQEWSTQPHFEKEVASSKGYVPEEFKLHELWTVERTDDNGNTFVVETNVSQRAAECLASTLESSGHRQLYHAKPQT